MNNILLKNEELMELKILKQKYQSDNKIYRRLKCIELLNDNKKPGFIRGIFDISYDAIKNWKNIYLRDGLLGLCEFKYEGRNVSEFEQYKDDIYNLIDHNIYDTYSKLYHDLAEKYTLKNKQNALFKFCKKIGI